METILIISQNVKNNTELESLFKQKGYSAISETNSVNAMQTARLFSPTLIILDMEMPAADKIGLCRNLRSVSDGAILMLVASHESMGLYQFFDAGADEYIRKPVTHMGVLIKSLTWLAKREMPQMRFSRSMQMSL